jgi:hypothetical protein
MITASSDNLRAWTTAAHERPASIEIVLLKRTFVLPWSQFLYAEGSNNEEIRIAFSTHDVVVLGSCLGSLLEDLSAQRVSLLREPVRAERFSFESAPRITSISVRKVE